MVNKTVYHFVGSNLGCEILLKMREYQKNGALKQRIEAPLYTLYWVSKEFHVNSAYFFIYLFIYLFIYFLLTKWIIKGLFSFIPWLLNFPDLPSYGKFEEKIHTEGYYQCVYGGARTRCKVPLQSSFQFP